MIKDEQTGSIFTALDQTVQGVLAYFEGSGSASRVRIGNWGVWEILCHFIFWHEVTVEGIDSVSFGGSPYRLNAQADVLNDRVLIEYQSISITHLVTRLRDLEERLLKAASNMPNLDAPVMIRTDGTALSGRQRLEMINSHWARHMAEFQIAELP